MRREQRTNNHRELLGAILCGDGDPRIPNRDGGRHEHTIVTSNMIHGPCDDILFDVKLYSEWPTDSKTS